MLESLRELQQRWRQAGSQLLLLEGNPVVLLPRLAQQLVAAGVAWNRDVEPLVRQRDRELATALKAIGVRVAADWDQLLVPPEQLKTGGGDPYRVYGPYWRSWEKQPKAKPVPAPSGLKGLPQMDLSGLPVLDQVPVDAWEGADLCPCRPGESAALEQLEQFSARAMEHYGEGRNLPGMRAPRSQCGFGPAASARARLGLQFECCRSAAVMSSGSRSRCGSRNCPAEFISRPCSISRNWRMALPAPMAPVPLGRRPVRLKAWQDGLTGVPIVDAAMRQLVQTGFMHNRCRMIVASFWSKT